MDVLFATGGSFALLVGWSISFLYINRQQKWTRVMCLIATVQQRKKKKLRTFWDVQLGKPNVIIIINSNKITPHVINDISLIAGLCYEETEGRGAGSWIRFYL